MAQAFIDYTISTGNEHLEKQIHELRNQTQLEFSDCDENLLLQALDEIEPFHCNETQSRNKRKRKPDNSDKEKKKVKLGSTFTCDLCDRVYKHRGTLNRHLKSHFTILTCEKCDKSFTRDVSLRKHKEKCQSSVINIPTKTKCTTTRCKEPTCMHCGMSFIDSDSL